MPVLSSHSGYRFGRQEYNHRDDTVRKIAERDGVIGLIFAEHQILDGPGSRKPADLPDSVGVLIKHIDRIHELTGSHRHVGIGSDLDGFIKPTLAGLQTMADMAPLRARWPRTTDRRPPASSASRTRSGRCARTGA